MKKTFALLLLLSVLLISCSQEEEDLYTIGIFQINDAPTMVVVRDSFIKALNDNGLRHGENVKLIVKNAMGDIPEAQRIAQSFVTQEVDMIVAFSTPCFQAAMHASREIPIVFSAVANPYLAVAGIPGDSRFRNYA